MKLKKKAVIALVLCAAMNFTGVAQAYPVFEYTSGETVYEVALNKSSNGEYDGSSLKLGAGITADYKVYLPFEGEKIEINYSCEANTQLRFSVGEEIYTMSLNANENTVTVSANTSFEKGNLDFSLVSDGDICINGISFYKKPKKCTGLRDDIPRYETSYTDYEEATQTTDIFNLNSAVIKSSGAKRYTDYENLSQTPVSSGGYTYIPIKTLARSFGYYCEYDKDKNWVLLRNDDYECVLKNGEYFVRSGAERYECSENVFYEVGGELYAPIEYFAEKAGRAAIKKGDFVIVDYKNLVGDVVEKHMADIEKEFAEYTGNKRVGTVYHVAQTENASDLNDGSEKSPFLTLEKAASKAIAGDRVIVHDGVYRETLRPENSGTNVNPIIFEAAEGENPIISALEFIGEPTAKNGNITEYGTKWNLGSGRNQIFIGGEAVAQARHPNKNTAERYYSSQLELSSVWPVMGNIKVQKGYTAVSATDLDQPSGYWNGAVLVSFNGGAWSQSTSKIASSEPGKLNLTDTCKWFWYDDNSKYGDWGYITETKNAIDIPGEWYWGEDKLYIYLPNDADANKIEAKKRQATINLSGKSNIEIKNIDTVGGGMILDKSDMCVINGGEHKYVGHYTYTKDQHYGYITDGDYLNSRGSPQNGEQGIYMGGSNDAVINTHIQYSAGSGIYAVGKYGYIENNLIEDCGYMGGYVGGIYITTRVYEKSLKNHIEKRGGFGIYNNTVRRAGRNVFHMAAANNTSLWNQFGQEPTIANEVAYNDFSDSSITARDTGVTYIHGTVLGTDRKKGTFHNNVAWNSWCSDGTNMGIYYDNWSQQGEMYDNIVFYTDRNIPYNGTEYFVQSSGGFKDSFATIDDWNNVALGLLPNGKSGIRKEDYPSQRYFASGCNPDFSVNFSGFDGNAEEYSAVNAVICDAELENGAAVMEANGAYAEFENVNFEKSCNAIRVSYYGDKYNNGCALELTVGDGEKQGITLYSQANYRNKLNSDVVLLPVCGGEHNIRLKKIGGDTIKIRSVEPVKLEDNGYEKFVEGKTYASTYSSVEGNRGNFGKLYKQYGDSRKLAVNNVYGGTVLTYDNVSIGEDCDYFAFAMGSSADYTGEIVKVYVSGENSETICNAVVEKSSWNDLTSQIVRLKKTLKSGVYSVRLEFVGNYLTSDVAWFGFVPKKEASKFPLLCNTVSARAYDYKSDGIQVYESNHLGDLNANSYVVYKDINFGESGINALKLKMGVSPDYQGSTVRVYNLGRDIDYSSIRFSSYSPGKIIYPVINCEKIGEFKTVSTGDWIIWKDFDVNLSKTLTGNNTIIVTFSNFASGTFKGLNFEENDYNITQKFENNVFSFAVSNNPNSEFGLKMNSGNVLCAALYEVGQNDDSVMRGVYNGKVNDGKTAEMSFEIPQDDKKYKVKVFLLDSFSGMSPIMKSLEYEIGN